MKTVAVVGLGKIGVPLAVQFAMNGCSVIGCDINGARVDEINAGREPFEGEADLKERLARVVRDGKLRATTDTASAVSEADVCVVIVPLIAGDDHEPDFSLVDTAVDAIAKGAHPGLLVCFETTMPVGSTRRLGERVAKKVPEIHVAFSPERVYSGRIFKDLATYPKLVGGVDPQSTAKAAEFYRSALPDVEVWMMRNAESAELAKLSETIYRDVNIALSNELARYAADRDIDITEVIRASNSQPFSHLHDPGVGVGGHCIPHYPWFVISDDPFATLMTTARAINDFQPSWLVNRIEGIIGSLENRNVLVLGVSYRAGVKEPTSSPGIDLIEILNDRGASCSAHDPLFEDAEIKAFGAAPAQLSQLPMFDAIILQAAHDEYTHIDWSMVKPGSVVADGRNALDPEAIRKAGAIYLGVGRP
ncbi:MAG: nucleotide sugar dehydrogenase [Actinomycetota bacterium]